QNIDQRSELFGLTPEKRLRHRHAIEQRSPVQLRRIVILQEIVVVEKGAEPESRNKVRYLVGQQILLVVLVENPGALGDVIAQQRETRFGETEVAVVGDLAGRTTAAR